MVMNLFSSFDPSSNWNISSNWISSILCLMTIPSMYWLIPSRLNFIWIKITAILHKEFKTLMGPTSSGATLIPSRLNFIWIKITAILHKEFKTLLGPTSSGATLIFISLFSFILINNFMGLFPYVFTSTSHMALTLSLALPLWLTFMLFGWINNTTHMFAHLVPQGTPPVLMPFMVCIETISNIIRPGTLAIRLSANMIAGHLLMTLLGNTGPALSVLMINILIIVQLLLLLLESAVSIIQSYVFAVLSTLYSSEVN